MLKVTSLKLFLCKGNRQTSHSELRLRRSSQRRRHNDRIGVFPSKAVQQERRPRHSHCSPQRPVQWQEETHRK